MHYETTDYANRSWHIQSAGQYLKEGSVHVQIQRFAPDLEHQVGNVALTLYTRDRPQSTAVTKGPYTISADAAKTDFRASAMIAAFRFSGAAGTYARFGKPLFEAITKGGR